MKTAISSFLCFIVICCFQSAQAQSYTLRGKLSDTLNQNNLPYASVSLIRASDSILETFSRAGTDGSFVLHPEHSGKYTLLITFPNFADYIDIVKFDAQNPTVDMGTIPMSSRSHLLSEFVLKQRVGAIKIKGDTTEYVADSFKVRENATVEDLLKKLPGIQVDKNGQVTAQGEKVQKILVDGEEFFSDDPAVVTRNLQANAIEAVQVFDKKSEKAEFTGIDDGDKTKTINLKLKEDRKRGYFGKLALGGGSDGFFENQGMINAFKGKRKIAAFGIMSNTGKIGLGWEDRDKFGSGNNSQFDAESGYFYNYNAGNADDGLSSSWNGTYNGDGLPTVWTGGLHYSNKWHGDSVHLSSNYRAAKQNLETIGNVFTIYSLPDSGSSYSTNQRSSTFSSGIRHRLDGILEWKIDSLSTLKVTANGGYSELTNNYNYQNDAHAADGSLINDGTRTIRNNTKGQSLNTSAIWKKKFHKKGRTLSVNLDGNFRNTDGTGYLKSNNNFYIDGQNAGSQIVDQRKVNDVRTIHLGTDITYTEPLSKKIFLELNYGIATDQNNATRASYNKNSTGEGYDQFDSVYSSSYDFDVLTNRGGSYLKFVFKKATLSMGGAVSNARFNQKDNYHDTVLKRNYTNFFPRLDYNYKVSQQGNLVFSYTGSTRQPTIDQIQPLQQNTDPLNVNIGNPALKQEFRHNLFLRFNDYKVLTGVYRYAGLGMTYTDNAISQSQTIGIGGSRINQYINVDGNYNGWAYGGIGGKIKKLDLNVGVNTYISTMRYNTLLNAQKNVSNYNNYQAGLQFQYNKEKKWDISYAPSATYSENYATINTTNTRYWVFEQEFNASFYLPFDIEIGTSFDWYIRQKTAIFDRNNNVFKWNAYVSKKFLKQKQLELRAYVNDILDQNIGYSRFGQDAYIAEKTNNTIRRYGLLSLIWNFTHSPKGIAAPQDGNQ